MAKVLPELRAQHHPDLVIANVENLAHGKGVTLTTLQFIFLPRAIMSLTNPKAKKSLKSLPPKLFVQPIGRSTSREKDIKFCRSITSLF